MSKLLILGGSGMLGQTVFRSMAADPRYEAYASVRSPSHALRFAPALQQRIMAGIDVLDSDSLASCLAALRPDVVINCVGLVKQLHSAADPLSAIPINALLPHRLARLCSLVGARLVHISTDCVFSGRTGLYRESDQPDAEDLYGRSKLLGEVSGAGCITLRTSIIGHELDSRNGVLEWFLSQSGSVDGYTKAFFSGLSTFELARVIGNVVIPDRSLSGLWHVSSERISKFDLLHLFAQVYGRSIDIRPVERVVVDRSLDSGRFKSQTGYCPPAWSTIISEMRADGERA